MNMQAWKRRVPASSGSASCSHGKEGGRQKSHSASLRTSTVLLEARELFPLPSFTTARHERLDSDVLRDSKLPLMKRLVTTCLLALDEVVDAFLAMRAAGSLSASLLAPARLGSRVTREDNDLRQRVMWLSST